MSPTTPTQVAEERIARLRLKARERADASDREDTPGEHAAHSKVARALTRAQKGRTTKR